MKKITSIMSENRLFPWEKPFTKEALNVAVPVVIQSIFSAVLHIVDNVMIGKLGEVELAGVTQANRITFLFQLVMFGLAGGSTTYLAQYWGKRDLRGIRRVMGLNLCFSLAAALLFALPSMLAPRTLMRFLLNDQSAIDSACQYLPMVAFSYIAICITQCFGTVLRSTEQARLPMAGSITALFTNTVLNYCLIYGRLGFPRLGVLGGAIATVAATVLELLIVVIFSYVWKLPSAARIKELVPRSLSFVKQYAMIVLPVMLNEGLWSLGIVMQSAVYGYMGTSAVAAISIFNAVEQIALTTARGLTSAAAVLIGKRIGAGDESGAYHTAQRMIFASILSGVFSGCIILLTTLLPLSSFFTVSAQAMQNAKSLLLISAGCVWIQQLGGLFIVGILRSGGDVRYSLWLDVGTLWLIGLPMAVLGGLLLKLGVPFVYLMAQADSAAKVFIGFRRFWSKKWIRNLVK